MAHYHDGCSKTSSHRSRSIGDMQLEPGKSAGSMWQLGEVDQEYPG